MPAVDNIIAALFRVSARVMVKTGNRKVRGWEGKTRIAFIHYLSSHVHTFKVLVKA
jgi:hypothetical protein